MALLPRARMTRTVNGQPEPAQVARRVDCGGSRVAVTDSSRVPFQRARILAGLAGESWYRPQGGLALITRPGAQVAVNGAKAVPGACAPIR